MEPFNATGAPEFEALPARPSAEYTAMQRFFLTRLNRLLVKSREVHAGPTKEWQRTLVKKAIFSTFNDCIALSLETEALQVVRAAVSEG